MNLLQDILGLFSRKRIIKGTQLTDDDYLSVAKLEMPKTPGLKVPRGKMSLIKASEIKPEIPGPTSKTYTSADGGTVNVNLNDADLHIIDIAAISVAGNLTIELSGIPNNTAYYGVNQIAIIQTSAIATTPIINVSGGGSVVYPLGITPVWSVSQDKTDMITVTGYINQEYLAVGTTGF